MQETNTKYYVCVRKTLTLHLFF